MATPILHDSGGAAPTLTATLVATAPFLVSVPADQPSCNLRIDASAPLPPGTGAAVLTRRRACWLPPDGLCGGRPFPFFHAASGLRNLLALRSIQVAHDVPTHPSLTRC